ncbi:hypothetical protein [uncultured Desulfobulbus sp.]|uniref:lipase family protein n=1 Tax=uncultured Desulfobulbus sp. TaxID=239745 RepID=UPI0029C85B8B|nr:hypothetical protein [uncultured Desulfobulbus sp.]
MATQFEIDCALLAGVAYRSTRDPINRFPVPSSAGWSEITQLHRSLPSGFEAVSFQRGNEIVISYAGTYPGDPNDLLADVGLATGNGSIQLTQAIDYYLQVAAQVRATNPNATITLTGHSLGGGLAALVGVFFGVRAVTFDQAPFANTAKATSSAADDLLSYLQNTVYADAAVRAERDKAVTALTAFLQQRATNGGIPNSSLVSTISVEGELLSYTAPISCLDIIGPPAEILTHGDGNIAALDLPAGTGLHSQALLTAFLYGDLLAGGKTLCKVSKKLPQLVEMLCDTNLFSFDTDKNKVNFLERLVQHQVGTNGAAGDAMINRFTGDLWKIAQDGGLSLTEPNLAKMLTAFAMEAYYTQGQPGKLTATESLFQEVDGGIRFDRTRVATDLTAAKGYQYWMDYKTLLSEGTTVTGLDLGAKIQEQLPGLTDWYIQAGSRGMTATAGTQRAFMLGGAGIDHLTGGSANDVLVGNGGRAILDGGAGDDLLLAGWSSTLIRATDEMSRDHYPLDTSGDTLIGGVGNDTLIGNGGIDNLEGGDQSDHLYGMGGNDVLTGGKGDDYLEGGEGIDTYVINTGDGHDTIVDEGRNILKINGETFAGVFVKDEGSDSYIFTSDDGAVTRSYTMTFHSPGTLTLDGSTSITFANQTSAADFEDGDFGLTLFENETPDQFDITLTGDDSINSCEILEFEQNGTEFFFGFSRNAIANADGSYGYLEWIFFQEEVHVDTSFMLTGGAGNDMLAGLLGKDHLVGGDGNDWLWGVDLHTLNPSISPQGGDLLEGGPGNDWLNGSGADDILYGGDDADILAGLPGKDLLMGESGNDFLVGGAADDVACGGEGDDILLGDGGLVIRADLLLTDTLSINLIYEDDYLMGMTSPDIQFDLEHPGAGNDRLFGGAGNDCLVGGLGDDVLSGDRGKDVLWGDNDAGSSNGGDDSLYGGAGDDLLFGGGGSDYIFGDTENDTLFGNDGEDELHGGSGNDGLLGGAGNDLLFGDEGDEAVG